MTNEQYKKYQKIEEEIAPVKEFLLWAGNKYKDEMTSCYTFSIKSIGAKFRLRLYRNFCDAKENTFELPIELQRRIVKVMEEYIDEKEQEKADI